MEVHDRMEMLFSLGMLPVTTNERRIRVGRSRSTRGTEYVVPEQMREAFNHGYTGPNFQDACLMSWQRATGAFRLIRAFRGG